MGEGLSYFIFSGVQVGKKNVFTGLEASLNLGGSCDVCEWDVLALLSTSQRNNT